MNDPEPTPLSRISLGHERMPSPSPAPTARPLRAIYSVAFIVLAIATGIVQQTPAYSYAGWPGVASVVCLFLWIDAQVRHVQAGGKP